MSRSYRKTYIINVEDSSKRSKRKANEKVRRYLKTNDVALQNSDYKKVYESYDIHDFPIKYTLEDAINDYEQSVKDREEGTIRFNTIDLNKFPTLDSWLNHWKKKIKCK